LLKIPGVGPNKRRALLTRFGSVQGVREATVADIATVAGFSEASATRILLALGVVISTESPAASTADNVSTDPNPEEQQ
jgi:excinuclease ABC subunit C